jgi:hypothetical protein
MKSQVVTPHPINAVNAIAKNRIGLNSERMIILIIFIFQSYFIYIADKYF